MTDVRIVALGDSALSAQFDERIDPAVNARAIACADAMVRRGLAGVRDVVPAFRSVTVYFDPLATDVDLLAHTLRDSALAREAGDTRSGEPLAGRSWGPPSGGPERHRHTIDIPVCYDAEFALDMDDVCRVGGISAAEVVALHTGAEYRVYMLGFVPGFAYLGSVDPRIATPRRQVPRTAVPRGAVGIAGSQTGIYPRQTAGGWNIIGRTPRTLVSLDAARPTLLAPGDIVRFHAIDRDAFERWTEPAP